MGLLDILNDIQGGGVSNDPRAQAAPARQGMSPMAKALLGLLAIYAMKHMRRADAPPTQQGRPGANVDLPGFVDQLTPQGRVPTEDEAERMV